MIIMISIKRKEGKIEKASGWGTEEMAKFSHY